MRNYISLSLTIAAAIFNYSAMRHAPPGAVTYYQGSAQSAFELAAAQNKLVLLLYSANYCLPCRVLEETTFADQDLASFLSEKAVVFKVDIEKNREFYQISDKYPVDYLPTLYVLYPNGEVADKTVSGISSYYLRDVVNKYSNRRANLGTSPTQATSPALSGQSARQQNGSWAHTPATTSKPQTPEFYYPGKQEAVQATCRPGFVSTSAAARPNSATASSTVSSEHRPETKPVAPAAPTTAPRPETKPAAPAAPTTAPRPVTKPAASANLTTPTQSSEQMQSFALQIGAFGRLENAQSKAMEFELNHAGAKTRIFARTDPNRGTMYHVLVIGYSTREAAQLAKNRFNVEALVTDVSRFTK